ncbi:hypothetical protein G7Y79_00018g045340 [Physcia stellaris]|nr:hypothetical protein G7Y79_00018g045340 [Physcia stellaris]
MILDGADPHSYGRLHNCGNDNGMFAELRAGRGTLAGVGILVMAIQVSLVRNSLKLAAIICTCRVNLMLSRFEDADRHFEQERKLSFLLRCAKLILHDIQTQDLSVSLIDDPGEVILANDGTQYASLSTEILEAPYRLPPTHDISRIRSFVYAKRAEYEDEIWTLREDPSYFKETIWEWGEHRRERIRTETGATYPLLEKEDWWEAVIRTMIADTYTSYHCWDCLSRHVEGLVQIKAAHGEQFRDHGKLPKDYLDAVNFLEWLVGQAMLRPVQKWREGLAASPPLRQHFVYDLKTSEGYPMVPWDKEKDKFLWLIELPLFEDPLQYGMGNLMDALQWTISTNDQNRRCLSSWVASLLSELSLLGELERQVSLLNERPLWASKLDEEKDRNKQFKAQLDKDTVAVERLYWIFDRELNLAPLAIPLEKYNYPIHKRRTATTTRTMQEAEKELDAFWAHLDAQCFKHVGQTLHQLFNGSLGERQLSRTPNWVEPDAIQLGPQEKPLSIIPLEDRFTTALDLERSNEKTAGRDTQSTPKAKIKTRGTPAVSPPENAGILHEPDQTSVVPKIAVSKRALKVFSTLFFDDKQEASAGEIPWTEFLHAMASVGFTVQKLGGSAWIFAPTNDYFQRSFIFHEPHPLPKIPYRIARRLGGRLNRAYGWTSETFERA